MEYSGVIISRVSGFFYDSNNFAHLLSGVLPLLFVCALSIAGFGLRILCTVSLLLGLMSLVLTFSRGGLLALVTSLLLITIVSLKNQWRKKFRGSLAHIVVIGIVVMVLMAPLFSRIVTRFTKNDQGAAYIRIPLALTALRVIKREPLTGVGLGNYRVAVPYYDLSAITGNKGIPTIVHNMYLCIAAELGVPALGIFLWLSILCFRQGIIALTSADRCKNLFALGMLSGFAGMYFYGIFEDVCFGHPRFIVISAIGGFLMALKYPIRYGSL
ncbi:MAG: O-antigen ligase family protein [Candidatus Hodarchaeales archaeon]